MRALLEPTGLFVLEEFAVEAVDMTTALWFYDACSILEAAGILGIDKEDAARSEPDPMLRWKAEHAHDEHGEHEALHTGEAMQSAIESAFMALETTQAPYLYRTVCAGVDASSRGERAAERLLALEKDRIERGLLRAVGFRMVARP